MPAQAALRTAPGLSAPTPGFPEAERIARLRLARSQNVGPRTFLQLLSRFKSAERALEALPELAARGGNRRYTVYDEAAARRELSIAGSIGAELLVYGDPRYPVRLTKIDTPPPVVFVRGDPALCQRSAVAVVGARNASALGLRTARRICAELGAAGQVVVSGLARGIDTAAHEAALETGTIAVMAGGVDKIYPAENLDLAENIATGGLMISECPMGVEPTSRHFPKRNRLIAGLAEGVLLIEAASRSGSLITARYALDQGREVMAVPGAPEDPRASGCNMLIRDGAALIRNAEDILEALAHPAQPGLMEDGPEFLFDADRFGEDELDEDFESMADFDLEGHEDDVALIDQVMRLLGPTPVDTDELARACGASPADLSLVILELDLAGRIEVLSGGRIALAGTL